MTTPPRTPPLLQALAVAVILLALAWGLWSATQHAWLCDDAFISFRYARHLASGEGLVFNPGERVEGYSNLLWTLWIALGLRMGISAQTWALIWGVASYGGCIALLGLLHLRHRRRLEGGGWLLPAAAVGAAVLPDWNSFATSGMETSLFLLLLVGGYLLLADAPSRTLPLAGGALLFGMASITRPDGILFGAAVAVFLAIFSRRRFRSLLLFGAIVFAFWGGQMLGRWSYYGDIFPNTYYAKSAWLPWWDQGWHYVLLFFQRYWSLLAVLPLLVGAVWSEGKNQGESRRGLGSWWWKEAALATTFVLVWTLYVMRVGGDFMFARMMLPAVPFLLILLELALVPICRRAWEIQLALGAIVLALTGLSRPPVSDTQWRFGIADETQVYREEVVTLLDQRARVLRELVHGLPVRVAFLGLEARVMYEAEIPVAIECETGLTDRFIAHQALPERGRVGHEKHASLSYLIGRRKADLIFHPSAPRTLALEQSIPLWEIRYRNLAGWILHWDPAILEPLRRRGAVFEDFPAFLDHYIETLEERPIAALRRDFPRFELFYFAHVDDPRRRQILILALEKAGRGDPR